MVGYNVQTAVDVDTHLIVAHEVSSVGTDWRHLTRMGRQSRAILKADRIKVLADRGYYNGEELQSCEAHNIETYVPNSATSSNKAKGQFDRSQFR